MTITDFISKYSQLCDKYNHLYIHIGMNENNGIFKNNITGEQLKNYIKHFEKINLPIIKNSKGHICIYNNEYHYHDINEYKIIEYNHIDTFVTDNLLLQFSSVKYDNNTGTYDTIPDYKYNYEQLVIQIMEGCNIEINKKSDEKETYYTMSIIMSKPCVITKFLSLFSAIRNTRT